MLLALFCHPGTSAFLTLSGEQRTSRGHRISDAIDPKRTLGNRRDLQNIGDLTKGDDAVAIVHAILNLASSLKMTTTAEGVETAEQQELLRATGCNEMQGYLFSRPRPAVEILELLKSYQRQIKVA